MALLLGGMLLVSACRDTITEPRNLAPSLSEGATVLSNDERVRTRTVLTPSGGWQITETTLGLDDCTSRPGGSAAMAINDSSWIVGWVIRNSDWGGCVQQAFLLRPGKSVVNVAPRRLDPVARGINNAGTIVGSADHRPFKWTQSGGLRFLKTLGGVEGEAVDINDRGQMVGWTMTSTGARHPVLWSAAGNVHDLWPMTTAIRISTDGVVSGSAVIAGVQHAVTWSRGVMTDLGTRGEGAEAISADWTGEAVANYWDGANHGDMHAVFANTEPPAFVPVPTLGGVGNLALDATFYPTRAVVGWSLTYEDPYRWYIAPFYWSPASGSLRLSEGATEYFFLGAANALNGKGEIVGYLNSLDIMNSYAVLWTVKSLPN